VSCTQQVVVGQTETNESLPTSSSAGSARPHSSDTVEKNASSLLPSRSAACNICPVDWIAARVLSAEPCSSGSQASDDHNSVISEFIGFAYDLFVYSYSAAV
jgi:hypothetical protein